MRARLLIIGLWPLVGAGGSLVALGQTGYTAYTDWQGWARLSPRVAAGLASSYDRDGGNLDWSHYEWPEGLVYDETTATAVTIDGPGIIHRFWMPHLTADQGFVVRMYFDGEPTPRLDTTSEVLLAGAFGYFTAPLVTTCAGGQVCYEPVSFAQSLRIETINHEIPTSGWSRDRHYYQYSYSRLPATTPIPTYTGTLSSAQQAERLAVVALFENVGVHPAGVSPATAEVVTPATAIPAGQSMTLATLTGPALVRRFNLEPAGATDAALSELRLIVTYDHRPEPAIDVPVADFFGAGYSRAAYASLPLGTISDAGLYCYWPMPYREAVSIQLYNSGASEIGVGACVVEYEPISWSADLGYLHVTHSAGVRQSGQIYHPILSATGRGHYVGNLLYVEQDAFSFYVLEGDERISVDGHPPLHGTGLEDAYNGGYYYNWIGGLPNEPEGGYPESAVRPLHGILHVHRAEGVEYARADQYRWHIADRIPFNSSLDVEVECRYGAVGSRWTSVAFWYHQPEVPGDADADGDLDLADFAVWQVCMQADDPVCCDAFDADGSGGVELEDYPAFSSLLTGPW